jgi:hypothetical protein
MIVSVSFMYYPGDLLRQTSADVLFLNEWPVYIWQLNDFGSRTLQFIPVNKLLISDRLIVSSEMVGNPCNLQPYAAAITLNIMYDMAATSAILTCS